MTVTAIKEAQLAEFAEHVYAEQKEHFIQDFTRHLKSRIESGLAQFENGEYMSFEEFEAKFRKEYLHN